MKNYYLTSDITIHKDSQGAFECAHRHQGTLIDFEFFANRNEARREAVRVLNEMKEDQR